MIGSTGSLALRHWDGRGAQGRRLASGVYFLRLEAGDVTARDRVMLVH